MPTQIFRPAAIPALSRVAVIHYSLDHILHCITKILHSLFCLFLTEEAYSHGGLQTRKLETDSQNLRMG